MPLCLIVDESDIVRKVAGRILAGDGFETAGGATLGDAMASLGERPTVDLVLLSGALPGASVDIHVRALREATATRNAAILVSIVETNLGLMTRAKRAGANGFVFRPFDRPSLLSWVERHVAVPA